MTELTRQEAIQILFLLNHYVHHVRGGSDSLAADGIKLMQEVIGERIISFTDCLHALGVTIEEIDPIADKVWAELELIKDCRTPEEELDV